MSLLEVANAPAPKTKYFSLEITTSALCDLSCTYCFEGEKTDTARLDSDLHVLYNRIEQVLNDETWFQENYEMLNITFWGGEPTLNPRFIVEIMNHYRDNPKVTFHLYTNGFNLVNIEHIINNVDVSKLNIQFSYDGKFINDKFRLTKNKKTTGDKVISNLITLAKKGVKVHLKSTLPIENMEVLYDTWKEFYNLQLELWAINKDNNISYAPTIDYIANVADDHRSGEIAKFREQFLKIAKEEIAFFKEHKRFLCSWFGGKDTRHFCSAGYHMAAIDQRGNLYACHGVIYSKNKEELKASDIYDDQFLNNVKKQIAKHEISQTRKHKECLDCVATTCLICPISSYDKSTKTNFDDKWSDNWVNKLCGFYKTFGEIDRAVQRYIFQEATKQEKVIHNDFENSQIGV